MTEKKYCPQTGKVCYGEKAASEKISWFHRHNGRNAHFGKNIPSRSYPCPFCGYYHLTKQKNKRRHR